MLLAHMVFLRVILLSLAQYWFLAQSLMHFADFFLNWFTFPPIIAPLTELPLPLTLPCLPHPHPFSTHPHPHHHGLHLHPHPKLSKLSFYCVGESESGEGGERVRVRRVRRVGKRLRSQTMRQRISMLKSCRCWEAYRFLVASAWGLWEYELPVDSVIGLQLFSFINCLQGFIRFTIYVYFTLTL